MPLASTSTGPSFGVVAVITTGVDDPAGFDVEVDGDEVDVDVGADGWAEGVTLVFDDPHAASVSNAETPNAETPSAFLVICISRRYG